MKKQKIGKQIALILMGCLILFNLLTAFFSITGLNARGILPLTFLTVESGSMEPEMSVGDLLIDWEVPYEELEIGDDVTFQQNDEFITHRIIRKDGSRIVTRGLANNTEDTSFGPQDYCAKVILVIPFLGYVLDFLSKPLCLLLALLLIAGLFYGTQYADWILDKAENRKKAKEGLPEGEGPADQEPAEKKPAFDWGSPAKVLAMVLVMSFLFVSPMMTQAKYVAIIDARKAAVADTLYMTSNILTGQGASYTITGWSGTAKGLTLNINNYDNDLKHNEAGKDLLYAVRIVKLTESSDGKSYSSSYSVNVNSQPAAAAEAVAAKFTWPADIPEGDSYGPFLLPGNDTPDAEGKYGLTHKLDLVVKGDDARPLQAGDKIRFRIYATTSDSYGYRITLSGDYTLVVAGGTSFIEATSTSTSPGNILVGYNIKTGLLNGSGYRNIKITWNSQRMYLNEYEKSAFDTLLNYKRADGTYDPSLYYRGTGLNNDTAFLIIPLPAYANVTLQFFKQDSFLNQENDQFVITAAEDVTANNTTGNTP